MEIITQLLFAFVMLGQPDQAVLVSSHQVFQRDAEDQANIVVALPEETVAGDRVKIRVSDATDVILADEALRVPEGDERGVNFGPLDVGGPYAIELSINGQIVASYTDLYVGDIWILAGQSNMQGVPEADGNGPTPAGVSMMWFSGYDWAPASQPLHRMDQAGMSAYYHEFKPFVLERFIPMLENPPAGGLLPGVNCGMYFAEELKRRTGVPIGLIPCAVGGTLLSEWWPENETEGKPSLYAIMLRKVRAAGGRVRGMLWYQGESDAIMNMQEDYAERFEIFVDTARMDFKDPNLPILTTQLSRFTVDEPTQEAKWSILRQAQLDCAAKLPGVEMVSMVEATLWDPIHIDTPSQAKLGKQFAWLAEPLVNPQIEPRHGIALERVYFIDGDHKTIAVEYANVTGALSAWGPPTGFSVREHGTGRMLNKIYATEFDPEAPHRILLQCEGVDPENHRLAYAYGLNTYVNIHDKKGMAIPGFGPLEIQVMEAE